MNYTPYGRQNVTQSDIEEVVKVLKSDLLTQVPRVEEFGTTGKNGNIEITIVGSRKTISRKFEEPLQTYKKHWKLLLKE